MAVQLSPDALKTYQSIQSYDYEAAERYLALQKAPRDDSMPSRKYQFKRPQRQAERWYQSPKSHLEKTRSEKLLESAILAVMDGEELTSAPECNTLIQPQFDRWIKEGVLKQYPTLQDVRLICEWLTSEKVLQRRYCNGGIASYRLTPAEEKQFQVGDAVIEFRGKPQEEAGKIVAFRPHPTQQGCIVPFVQFPSGVRYSSNDLLCLDAKPAQSEPITPITVNCTSIDDWQYRGTITTPHGTLERVSTRATFRKMKLIGIAVDEATGDLVCHHYSTQHQPRTTLKNLSQTLKRLGITQSCQVFLFEVTHVNVA